jgi:hypothetical protein
MTARDAVIKFSVDSTQATAGMERIIANLKLIQTELIQIGAGKEAAQLELLGGTYKETYDGATQRIRQATQALKELKAAQDRVKSGLGAGIQRGSLAASALAGVGTKRDLLAPTVKSARPDQAALLAAVRQVNIELDKQKARASSIIDEFDRLAATAPRAYQELVAVQRQSLSIEEQLVRIRAGDVVAAATNIRLQKLREVHAELVRQKIALQENIRLQAPQAIQKRVDRGLNERKAEGNALARIKALDQDILDLQNKIAEARGRSADEIFVGRSGQELEALREVFAKLGPDTKLGDDLKEQEQLLELVRQRTDASEAAEAAGRRANDALASDEGLQNMAGVRDLIEEIGNRLGITEAQIQQAMQPDAIAQFLPALFDEIAAFELLNLELAKLEDNTAAFTAKQNELVASSQRLKTLIASGGSTTEKAISPDAFASGLKKQLPGLENLFLGVFTNLGRRFVATLQFAISAAFLFGVQRFIKEFIQTAIEVERAFADIETALAINIDVGRGTLQFRREVEAIRQDILALADDLNVLPTEANEAAFQMVARFKDTGLALVALRAQLLATKVSTIDQAEVLRALTAVAEGFASAQLTGNDTLSLQERLLRREETAALLYGRALDVATQIQQEFGISVEDTLEGTARATQVFRQLGFTMEQTASIVAATSRELGQTGAQAAERLNRSLGQLTDPKIRDALLDLASSSEAFSLGISDFEDGATAWKEIVDQFQRLERIDPAVAREILNIIGQRRELEAVAAALGTADAQQSILTALIRSTGAAERRFSFLEQTASETIKSIVAGFQELSQNFERLGGLASVKLFLKALDEIVDFINEALKLIIDFIDLVDIFNISPLLRQFVSLVASLLLAKRIGEGLLKTFRELSTTKIVGGISDAFSNFFGAAGGATSLRGLAVNRLAPIAAGAGRGAGAARLGIAGAFGIGKLGSAAAAAAPQLLGLGAIAIVAALSIKSLKDETDTLAKSYVDGAAQIRSAVTRARQQILEEGLTGADADKVRKQAALEAAQGAFQAAKSASPALLSILGATLKDVFQPLPATLALGDRRFELQNIEQKIRRPESVPGSTEFFREIIQQIQQSMIEDATEALKDRVKGLRNVVPAELAKQADTFDVLVPPAVSNLLGINTFGNFDARIKEIEALAADMSGTPDEIAGRQVEATLAMDALNVEVNEVLQAHGLLPQDIERSVGQITKAMETLSQRIQLGVITLAQANAERDQAIIDLEIDAAKFGEIGDDASQESTLKKSLDLQVEALAAINEQAELTILIGSAFRNDRQQIVQEIQTRSAQLAALIAQVGSGTPEVIKLGEELFALFKQLADGLKEQALQALRTALSQARTLKEQQVASSELANALRLAGARAPAGSVERDRLIADAQAVERDNLERTADDLAKLGAANIRLAGPILSSEQRLKSEIFLAESALKRALSPGEAAEAQVRLVELNAQQAQLELRRITAAAQARTSVRDSLGQQAIELKGLNSEQRLVAILFGRNTAEWHELQLAINNARARLFDMVLELESINRALGTDITNPLEQAEIQWIEASRKLQIPDLGDLERARAELEKNQADANLERARFDVALFDLKFLTETDQLGTGGYISALQGLLAQVDTSTHQGKAIFLEIQGLIEGLTEDIGNLAFNIPGSIRIPTLFEVRRAVQADSLGVNYQDNRQIDVRVNVETVADLGELLTVLSGSLQLSIPLEGQRLATGNAGLTVGPFN